MIWWRVRHYPHQWLWCYRFLCSIYLFFNKCLKDVKSFKKNKTLIDFILKNNSSYSQIKCLDYCFELDYYNNDPCNCTAPSFDKGWDNCFIKKENMNYTCLRYKHYSEVPLVSVINITQKFRYYYIIQTWIQFFIFKIIKIIISF